MKITIIQGYGAYFSFSNWFRAFVFKAISNRRHCPSPRKSLHNLRKLAKQTRYNLELFEPFYCPRYHQHAQEIREVQTILGEIQDYFVLNQTLSKLPKASLASKMPIISQLLQAQRPKAWQQWQNKQALFLNQAHRLELRKTVKYPLLITPLS